RGRARRDAPRADVPSGRAAPRPAVGTQLHALRDLGEPRRRGRGSAPAAIPDGTACGAAGAAADATADRGLAAPARGRTTAAGRVKGVAPLPPLRDRSREGEGRS